MKAISLWQPWASAIAAGLKQIETRSWPAPQWAHGDIAIHATTRWTREERNFWSEHVLWPEKVENRDAFRRLGILDEHQLPLGKIVAIVRLTGCKLTQFCEPTALEQEWGNFTPGRYAWFLENVRPLARPVPAGGLQRFWDWDPPAGFEMPR